MRNSLQLELQLKIKRANRFLSAKKYPQAIKQYTQGLQLYQQNRRYNDTVSQQFQSLLYSLRGNSYSLNLDSQLAQQDFSKSININPYSAVTLSRRAKHFMKQKKFSQAIQDIDLALLYDPENLSYLSLLNSIQNYATEMTDQQQRKHISSFITQVKNRLLAKPPTQSQSEQQNSQQMLNFSRLKKIDRKSIKVSPKLDKLQRRKSAIEFKQDQILMYQDDNVRQQQQQINIRVSTSSDIQQKLKQQQQQLIVLQAEQQEIRKSEFKIPQQFVLTKLHDKSRKSILRRTSINTSIKGQNMIFISTPGDKYALSKRSSISAATIKDIDGKVVTHQNQKIKFRPSISQLSKSDLEKIQQINQQNQKQNLTKTTPKGQKRKSCLRSSNRFAADQLQQLSKTAPNFLPKRKSSNFLQIKSIDGQYHHKPTKQSSQQQIPIDVKIQTQSDDDDNEHNIFGVKKQKKQVLQICDNMEQMPEVIQKKLNKKKSILKKDSFLQTSQLQLSWKNQKKKSVFFKTG